MAGFKRSQPRDKVGRWAAIGEAAKAIAIGVTAAAAFGGVGLALGTAATGIDRWQQRRWPTADEKTQNVMTHRLDDLIKLAENEMKGGGKVSPKYTAAFEAQKAERAAKAANLKPGMEKWRTGAKHRPPVGKVYGNIMHFERKRK